MRIPLSEFELHVKPEPLERGLTIYERGQVESIHSISKGKLEAVVHDAEGTWHPTLELKDEAVVGTSCACGQAGDALCRHAIAFVFAMEAGQFKEGITTRSGKVAKEKPVGKGRLKIGDEPAKAKAVKAKPPKPPKATKTASDILDRVPHEELVAFLRQECKLDKNIEIRLKAHFADLLPATTPAEVEKRVSETVQAALGKSKKVNKGAMVVLLKRLHEWTAECARYLENQVFDLAFAAAKSLLQALVSVADSTHSTEADVKAIKEPVTAVLDRIGASPIPEPMRLVIFQRALDAQQSSFRSNTYLRLLSRICVSAQEQSLVENLFKYVHDDLPQITQAHHEMLLRLRGKEAADEFAKKQANTRYFLNLEIEVARAKNDLKKAVKLAEKGLSLNQQYPSRLGHWANLVDELFTEIGDVDGRVELALRVYRMGYRTDRVSLKHIIEIAGRDRWVLERSKLISELDPRKWAQQDVIVGLYQVDQDIDGLERFISSQSLNQLSAWSDVMRKTYPDLYWSILTKNTEAAYEKKASVSQNLLTNLIRDMVRVRGKVATQEFLAKLLAKHPKNTVLAEVNRGIQQVMRFMYEGY